MATMALCQSAKAILMATPYRCSVKIHRLPQVTTDVPDINPISTDDYLIWVKDPRTSATGAAGSTAGEGHGYTLDEETEPDTRRMGLAPRSGAAGGMPGWQLYDVADGTRYGALLQDAETVFSFTA